MTQHLIPVPTRPGWRRAVGAIATACVVGAAISSALTDGVSRFCASRGEPWVDSWNLAFWGEHWFARAVGSLLATTCAGFLAGLLARSSGGRIAVVAALPATGVWCLAAIPSSLSSDYSTSDHLLAAALAIAIPFVAHLAGASGELRSQIFERHFDARPGTLLGVRWYHFVWIPFVANFVLAEAAWSAMYGSVWLVSSDAGWIAHVIAAPFLVAIYGSLVLLVRGCKGAYGILAGLRPSRRPGWDVARFALGYPIAAVACEIAITSAHHALSVLVSKLAGGN